MSKRIKTALLVLLALVALPLAFSGQLGGGTIGRSVPPTNPMVVIQVPQK